MPADEAVRLAIQIAGALEEAHAHGILHRDLKPANILVTSKGATKLLDFGLAKMAGALGDESVTQTIGVSGTLAYMAPEQAEGKPLDARCDIFSFGLVLYELLSGRRAFNSMAELLRDDPARLKSPVADVVMRCLAKEPSQRFQAMTDVKAALAGVGHARPAEQASIAVLPFANMSADQEQEFFSDGLAEEIINSLTHVPGLKVIARTSAFAFKGQHTDIRKIAEALGVTNILEGSVRKAGNRIRVTAQLVTASDGSHLWSERYDRELADVFAVQDEIAAAIAAVLKVKLIAGPRKYTPKMPAYEAYLKARHHRGRLTPASIAKYREYLEQAISLDPGFALAYVDMADSYLMSSTTMSSAHEVMPQVRAQAQKALDLDPSLPEAQAMIGVVEGIYNYDWKEAQRRFGLAMATDPVPPQVLQWHGFFCLLWMSQQPQAAAEQMALGLRDDPLNLLSRQCLASCFLAVGRLEDAALELRECIRFDPNLPFAYYVLALVQASQGLFADAAASIERTASFARWPVALGFWAGLLAKKGDAQQSAELLREVGDGEAYGAPVGLALLYLLSGEIDRAADWVQKAIEQRHSLLMMLVIATPLAKPLRSSPRWPALAKMMRLPESAA
jgi:serine/threonine-protein kinase